MIIEMFNSWYFFWITLAVCATVGLYFILSNRSKKTKIIVLESILIFGLALHFLKVFIPPYCNDHDRMLRDMWFTNICGANIALFPIIFLSKSKHAKDYMFYLGLISGVLAILYPLEPLEKSNQLLEQADIARFYFHHWELFAVPLLMVLLKLHTLDYRRVWSVPFYFLAVLGFIVVNQVLQSELGFVDLRNDNMLSPNYKNSSMIWGPRSDALGKIFTWCVPEFMRTIPVGEYAGMQKFWPLLWMIIPSLIYFIPLSFLISLIWGWKHFARDMKWLFDKIKNLGKAKKTPSNEN